MPALDYSVGSRPVSFSEPVNSVQGMPLADGNPSASRNYSTGSTCYFSIMGFVPFCFQHEVLLLRFTVHYVVHIYLGDYNYADVHVRSFIFCTRAGGITCS